MVGIILVIIEVALIVAVIIFLFISRKKSTNEFASEYSAAVNADLIRQNDALRNGAEQAIFLMSDSDYIEMNGWTFKTESGETLVLQRIASTALIGAHDSNGQARLVRGARYLLVRQDKN